MMTGVGMANRISLGDLIAKVSTRALKKDALEKYFEYDALNSRSFQPAFRLRTDMVDVSGAERTASAAGHTLALEAILGAQEAVREEHGGDAPAILAEGDSWFSHPLVTTSIDALQERGHDVENIAKAGDTIENIIAQKQYRSILKQKKTTHFLFSGGGNDVLGQLRNLVNRVNYDVLDAKNPSHVAYYIKPEFEEVLLTLRQHYVTLINDVRQVSPATMMIINGYGYARPQAHGIYIGDDFEFLGFELAFKKPHMKMSLAIVRRMVDRFNVMLDTLARNTTKVRYVDLRPAISQNNGDDWFDAELHPSAAAARRLADLFEAVLPAPAQNIPLA